MQGLKRRVVYITLYEGIAIVAASLGLALMSGQGVGHSGVLAVMASVVAVLWNLVFNTLFERWEARQVVRGRSVWRRIAHAIGFEVGLLGFLVPIFAWWMNVTLLQVRLLTRGLPGTDGAVVSPVRSVVVQLWFVCPLQVHIPTVVPFAVPRPVTSRHRPDCTPTIVPLVCSVHLWFVPPLHG